MNELDHCYLEALSEALKGNLGEALELRNEADALASEGFSFSENYGNKYPFIEEAVNTLLGSYDFTRCVRADGSAYGTRGKCKKGTEQNKAVDKEIQRGAQGVKETKEEVTKSVVKAITNYVKRKRSSGAVSSEEEYKLQEHVKDFLDEREAGLRGVKTGELVEGFFRSQARRGSQQVFQSENPRYILSDGKATGSWERAVKKANAKEGRLAKGDSRTPAARKSEAMAQRAAETKAKAKEPARRWVNNREFAQAGVMHPNMASEMKVGMSTDFYDKKTGDKMSGKVVSNDGKFISIKADKDGREAAGAVQRFKIAREAGSPDLQ